MYENFSEIEFLNAMLKIAGYKNTNDKTNKLISKYGTFSNIMAKDNIELLTDKLINKKFLELRKIMLNYVSHNFYSKMINTEDIRSNTSAVVAFLEKEIAYEVNERFDIIFLSTNFEVISFENISKGTIDRSYVFIRTVVKRVLALNAKNIIISHNHPSGSLEPSKSDIEITQNIRKALSMFEIDLVDHIIISKKGYFSFAEGGII